jgi:TFIIF-interacting CTD phosphatase-like protein
MSNSYKQMKHIILDLDETLINISSRPSSHDQFQFRLGEHMYYGRKRPGLEAFLNLIFTCFRSVSIWTAATRDYADHVIAAIFTPAQRARLNFLFTRNKLKVEKNGVYSKPLRKIFQTSEAKKIGMTRFNTIMIDDREIIFKNNKGNGIVIKPWIRDPADRELYRLARLLKHMCDIKVKITPAQKALHL